MDGFPEDLEKIKQEYEAIEEIVETHETDFPQCRGMSFEEFWEWLPHKIELYDYEKELLHVLESEKYLWVKKATGLGITELLIRWMAWRCVSSDDMKNKQIDTNIVLITGPRIDLSITIMTRLKNLFDKEFKTKETVCILNGSRIEAFPSHHLATARGLNPQIVFLDEADFFPPGQQQEARDVSERYIAKTNPHIIMVSTPNLPGGLFETMEKEDQTIYTRKTFNYERGLNKIYSEVLINKAKESPSFEREYNLKYGYGIGNIFAGLDDIISSYSLILKGGPKGCYGDPAFGSSNFGICAMEKLDNVVYVKEAKEYPRPSPSAMLDVLENLAKRYDGNCKIDATHPGFIRDLNERGIPALPVNFGSAILDTEDASRQSLRSKMTINAAQMVKEKKVRIHPMFTELISQLRAAQFDDKGGVDKKELNFDVGDTFLMGCWDLKEHDYSAIHLSHDGHIVSDLKVKKSKSLTIKTEVIE